MTSLTPDPAPAVDHLDVEAVLRVPRVSAITAGPGGRAVIAVQEADEHGSRLVSALWEIDPAGGPARRLTRSEKGESSPHLLADGALLFTSSRPDPAGTAAEDTTAIWRLPASGEAEVLASAPGGLSILAVADDGSVLAATDLMPGATLEDDAERRAARKDAKRTTIWHTGMPIRQWDHEIGDSCRHLVLVSPDGTLRDLTPDAGTLALNTASADLSRDGRTVVTEWTERTRGGETRTGLMRIDTATLARTELLAAGEDHGYDSPALSPDGALLAVVRRTVSTPTDTSYGHVEIHPLTGGDVVEVDLGDLTAGQLTWTDDGTLLVSGDLHSSGAVLAVDPASGAVRTLVDGGVFSSLSPAGDGSVLALRSDMTTPARPVRITADGAEELTAPGAIGALPGTLEQVRTTVDGVEVPGWLCVPEGASAGEPAPVLLWVHGGPHGSYNAWSWRWNPWLFVARGYGVLLPDPAMSTGYGDAGLNRGWPRRPDVVYAECEALLDLVLERPELDDTRTAMLGASFGGFMANWIAGHTDRFHAIVTHAGLWALPQQHRTTDAAASKMRVHRHEDEDPAWYRAFSPHEAAGAITTPMLVTHGNRDYRVPISEALRLWWDLVSGWDGAVEDMPHRFLQLTSENHWVLTPSNAVTWNLTVLAFLEQHVRGGEPIPEVLPW